MSIKARQNFWKQSGIVAILVMVLTLSLGNIAAVAPSAAAEEEPSTLTLPVTGTIMVFSNEDPENVDQTPLIVVFTDDDKAVSITGTGLGDVASGDRFDGEVVIPVEVQDEASLRVEPTATEDELANVTLEVAEELGVTLEARQVELTEGLMPEEALSAKNHKIDIVWLGKPGDTAPSTANLSQLGEKAGQFWTKQTAGVIPNFTVGSVRAVTTTTDICNFTKSINEGRKIVGTTTGSETRHLAVVVAENRCPAVTYLGLGSIGSGIHAGGYLWMSYATANPAADWNTLTHELGHNLSLNHSNTLVCGDKRADAPSNPANWNSQWNCVSKAYEDLYDVMGYAEVINGGQLAALNISQKVKLGTATSGGALKTISISGGKSQTIVLPGTSNYSGVQGLEIIDPQTQERIYVEFRDGQGAEVGTYYQYWGTRLGNEDIAPGVRFMRLTPRQDFPAFAYSTLSLRQRGTLRAAESYPAGNTFKSYTAGVNGKPGISVQVVSTQGSNATLKIGLDNGLFDFTRTPVPTISGMTYVGNKLSGGNASSSLWTPAPSKVTYQWLRNGEPIQGATGANYYTVKADCGTRITFRATASLSNYNASAGTSSSSITPVCPTLTRIGATDRYATAVNIVKGSFPTGNISTMYIATGTSFPDALAAAPAAAVRNAPLLLVPSKGTLPQVVLDEIAFLNPRNVVVVGGTGSISNQIFNQIKTKLSATATIERVGGNNRYQTARLIVQDAFPATINEVYIATGRSFPDALSASAAAGGRAGAVILTAGTGNSLESEVATALKGLNPRKIYIIGGTGSISAAIETNLRANYPAVERLSGADRYTTSQAINAKLFTMSSATPAVGRQYWATGTNYPDALAGAVAAAKNHAPLYVIPGNCVPRTVLNHLKVKLTMRVTLLGGTNALTDNVTNLQACK